MTDNNAGDESLPWETIRRLQQTTTQLEDGVPITQEQLDNWFVYHKPTEGQPEQYEELREAGKKFSETIVRLTPPSADQSAAIRLVREAVFTANAAIACGGK